MLTLHYNLPAEYCLGNNSLHLHLNVDTLGGELPDDGGVDTLGGLKLGEDVGTDPSEDTPHVPSVQRGVGNLSILSIHQGQCLVSNTTSSPLFSA